MYWQNIYQQDSSIHSQSLWLIFFQLSLWYLCGCYFIFWLFLDNLNLHTTPNFILILFLGIVQSSLMTILCSRESLTWSRTRFLGWRRSRGSSSQTRTKKWRRSARPRAPSIGSWAWWYTVDRPAGDTTTPTYCIGQSQKEL